MVEYFPEFIAQLPQALEIYASSDDRFHSLQINIHNCREFSDSPLRTWGSGYFLCSSLLISNG
jgi:hypothetical protein